MNEDGGNVAMTDMDLATAFVARRIRMRGTGPFAIEAPKLGWKRTYRKPEVLISVFSKIAIKHLGGNQSCSQVGCKCCNSINTGKITAYDLLWKIFES